MKNIYLEITPFFPTEESFRGPYIYDQVKAIERNSNFDVKVVKVVSIFNKEPEIYEYQGVRVHTFKAYDLPSSIFPGLFHDINLIRFEAFIKKTVGIDIDNIAIIHSHVAYPAGALAVDFGKKHGIKNFVQHHGLDVMQLSNGRVLKGTLKKWNNTFIQRRFLKTVNMTDLNIGVSQKVLDELNKVDGFSNPKSYVLYNGVDTSKFYKIPDAKKEPHIFTIGCIGNFWKTKDQITLLKALDLLVNEKGIETIKVIFVGSGPTLEECMHFVREKNLSGYVEFKSEIDHTKLNDFYNSLDLFVLPSYYEALGCVYMEALQIGIPIIAVKGQGIEEVIHEKNKTLMLIDPHNYMLLAKFIECFFQEGIEIKNYDLDIDRYLHSFLMEISHL